IYPMVDDGVMLRAMQKISACGKAIAIHAENQSIVECFTAMFNKLPSVRGSDYVTSRPAIAETEAIQRMIFLAKHANVNLHILHLSAAEGADLIAQAQKTGQKVTVETCPHYLVLDNKSMDVYGPYAKCNPPLREKDNQEKLWRALRNGTISCLVSDHSPYTSVDKDSGLEDIRLAPPGINGLELGLPLMISEGVHAGKATLIDLALWMSTNPAKLMGIYPQKGHISIGADADFVLVDPKKKWEVVSEKLETKNKWSPYAGWQLQGKVMQTILRGKTVYQEGTFLKGAGYGKFVPCHLP
ncbi:allantoinase, partial [bacterium]|nr:allantoinase [bacterium]